MKTEIILFVVIIVSGATLVTQNVFARSHHTESQPTTLEGTQPAADSYGNAKADACINAIGSSITSAQIDQCYAANPTPVVNGCNNTETTGPVTDFFNRIGDCPVHVLFESANSAQLEYSDMMHGDSFVGLFETGSHWYEISKTDDGYYTTVVLAPLR